MKYYALDYVNPIDNTCELVYRNKLYHSKEEAEAARKLLPDAEFLEVNWYTLADLEDDVYTVPITITEDYTVELA